MLSALDTQWVTNSNNGLQSHGHPHWRMVQLETAKLLELGCVLPAVNLPHFQMYRWAFVRSQYDWGNNGMTNGETNSLLMSSNSTQQVFIPHVTRIAQLMDLRYVTHSPVRIFSFRLESFRSWLLSRIPDPDTTKRASFSLDLPKYQQSPRIVRILFDVECSLADA